jgi:uncharacterized OsmC-like protein
MKRANPLVLLPYTEKIMQRNGIDIDHLRGFVGTLGTHPEAGTITVRTTHRWDDGFAVDGTCETLAQAGEALTRTHHTFRTDWPEPLAGDTGPTPGAESVLAAVGACVATTYVAKAALAGIALDELEVTTHGRVDLRGLFEVGSAPPRFSEIEVVVRVAADVPGDVLDALGQTATRTSPAYDSLANPVPMKLSVERMTQPVAG